MRLTIGVKMQKTNRRSRNKHCHPDGVWKEIRSEIVDLTKQEPALADFFHETITAHNSLTDALCHILSHKLSTPLIPAMLLKNIFNEAYSKDKNIVIAAAHDICATVERDPAVDFYSTPLLYLKGFHALQSFRVANWLWHQDRHDFAIYLQNHISAVCQVDVHPAATIGCGIMFDHATGIVIGETAVIEDDVSILQNVTLGGTGKECGNRHPKVRTGVMIGAGAKILGNIEIGEGAKIAAGSVVLGPVPSHTTAVGVPARIVGRPKTDKPSLDMDQKIPNYGEFIGGDGI